MFNSEKRWTKLYVMPSFKKSVGITYAQNYWDFIYFISRYMLSVCFTEGLFLWNLKLYICWNLHRIVIQAKFCTIVEMVDTPLYCPCVNQANNTVQSTVCPRILVQLKKNNGQDYLFHSMQHKDMLMILEIWCPT